MRTLPLAILCLLAAFLPACRGGQNIAKPAVRVESRVRLIMDDGRTIEKPISLESESGVESLRQLVGAATGRFVLTITTRRTNDKFDQEIEGRLEKGILEGPVDTYLVLGTKRQLVSEETYRADVRQGAFVSYYPITGSVQMRGSFDAGAKNGDFLSFYPNRASAVRMHYDHDQLDGRCEVYDNSGAIIASGLYKKGAPASGTFVEDLNSFLMQSIDDRPITVRIATVRESVQSGGVIERTINNGPIRKGTGRAGPAFGVNDHNSTDARPAGTK
jgi:hypothetical protein